MQHLKLPAVGRRTLDQGRRRARGDAAGVALHHQGARRGADQDRHGRSADRQPVGAGAAARSKAPNTPSPTINKKGGILGRQVELLVEDSANDVGTGVQKTHKLIDRDKVDVIFGDVNSGIAYAMSQVTAEKKVFHIVPGGHTDPITGTDCKWNVFRICNTTVDGRRRDHPRAGQALRQEVVLHHARLRLRPYAAGRLRQEPEGGWAASIEGDMLPIATTEFSATLIKAKAYKPNVLLNNMGGLAQIDCMKQFVQFGMDKDMALGGALFELESVKSVPKEAQAGWWDMEWWWNQPERAGGRRVRRRLPQGDRQDADRAPLVRLCRGALRAARGREGEVAGRPEAGARRWRTWSCRRTSRCSRARSSTARAITN